VLLQGLLVVYEMIHGTSSTKSCRTISPDGTFTVIGPALRPLENTPEIVYAPVVTLTYNNCPALSAMLLAMTVPTELVIVIVRRLTYQRDSHSSAPNDR